MAIIILIMACAFGSVLIGIMLLLGSGLAWALGIWLVIMMLASSLIVWRGLTASPYHEQGVDHIALEVEALEGKDT